MQSPWPSLPPLPLPHEKVAVRVTARTCWEPQETWVTNSSLKLVNREGPGKKNFSSSGTPTLSLAPRPSLPSATWPQPYTSPLSVRAQVWFSPQLTVLI